MKMYLSLIAFLLAIPVTTYSDELQYYVIQFQDASEKYGLLDLKTGSPNRIRIKNLTVQFGKKEKDEAAYCIQDKNAPIVVVDTEWWNNEKRPSFRKMVMFHEFGHCVLFREHCEGFTPDGMTRSLMSAKGTEKAISDYEKNEDYYLQELFYGTPNCPTKEVPFTDLATGMDELTRRLLK